MYQKHIRHFTDTFKDSLKKFFQKDSTEYPNLASRIPVVDEWREGDFDFDVYIEKSFPDKVESLPALVIQFNESTEESSGLGDGYVGTVTDDDGVKYSRRCRIDNIRASIHVGTKSITEREDLLDLVKTWLEWLKKDPLPITGEFESYSYSVADSISVGNLNQTPMGEDEIRDTLFTGEVSFEVFAEGFEDIEITTLSEVSDVEWSSL